MHSGSQGWHIFGSSQMSVDAKLSWNWGQMENLVLQSLPVCQGFVLTSLKLTCSALVFPPPFACIYWDYLALRQNIQTEDKCGFMSWKKRNNIPKSWGQRLDTGICVVLVFWRDSLVMWFFLYNACFFYPSLLKWSYAAWQQNKLLCLVAERSFPSTYYSSLRSVVKNVVLILTKIDSQHEYATCLASLLDVKQGAQQALNNGIVSWFGD